MDIIIFHSLKNILYFTGILFKSPILSSHCSTLSPTPSIDANEIKLVVVGGGGLRNFAEMAA
jgi:hypothetical protein